MNFWNDCSGVTVLGQELEVPGLVQNKLWKTKEAIRDSDQTRHYPSVVHEFMPETESLPDIVLDHLPYQEWALWASEITIQLQVGFAIAMIIFHKHR